MANYRACAVFKMYQLQVWDGVIAIRSERAQFYRALDSQIASEIYFLRSNYLVSVNLLTSLVIH